jgi:phosphoenolpyruvate carboxykinase (ATP)
MSTIEKTAISDITASNGRFSAIRSTVETAFYGNNVTPIETAAEGYQFAKKSPGTIITDIPIKHAKELDLSLNSKVLVNNNGKVVGRTAAARRIIGQPGIDADYYSGILREAVFKAGKKQFHSGKVVIGLAHDFMVKSHIMLPEEYDFNLYSYLLNFQIWNAEYSAKYDQSQDYQESDIYLYADPDWSHPDFPQGLALFDPLHNCAAILGLRYFGELKKASLTLAWGTAHRNGYIACHGGMKQYKCVDDSLYTMAAFGLSGSGKSTITLAKQKNKGEVLVLHDDAFVINKTNGSTVALEPAYFDKTQDYPMASSTVDYFLTVQNVGVTLDEAGHKVLVNEDIRNNNGRTVKSRYVTPNRVDYLAEKIDAVFWIMKDDTLPPVIRVNDPVLAAIFGATLATKRSTAENVVTTGDNQGLVIEPFANPFRSYALGEDYQDFHDLFAGNQTDCYILNTGFFNGKKVAKEDTLGSIDAIVEKRADFQDFGPITAMSYLPVDGFPVDFTDHAYVERLLHRMEFRLDYINKQAEALDGYNKLPDETGQDVAGIIEQLKKA